MTDDTAAKIIAELEGDAEFIDGGGFSIDPEAARRKLADRQLADPNGWILLVMEAAELAGVEAIEIQERPLGLVISMRGAAGPALAPAGEIEELFSWVFVDLSSLDPAARRRYRARQLLALGVNAALARPPVHNVALASITPEAGRRMVLRPKQSGVIGAIQAGADCLELRFDAVGDANGELMGRSELACVAERCGWGRAPIEILGRRVDPRPEPAKIRAFRDISLDPAEPGGAARLLGRAELITKPVPPSLTVVANGVALESIPLAGWATGFRAVIYEGYERDLSLGHAIRNPEFDRLFFSIRGHHDAIVHEVQSQGGRVQFSSATPARVDPKQGRTLGAMFNDASNSIGHTSAWGALGLGMFGGILAMGGALPAAAVLGVLALGSGGVAAYFLRMRKVFGDEG